MVRRRRHLIEKFEITRLTGFPMMKNRPQTFTLLKYVNYFIRQSESHHCKSTVDIFKCTCTWEDGYKVNTTFRIKYKHPLDFDEKEFNVLFYIEKRMTTKTQQTHLLETTATDTGGNV